LDSKNNVVASYLAPERSIEAVKEALGRAKEAAGFSPDLVVSDDCPIYNRGVNVLGRRTRHVRAHFEGKFVPYKEGVLWLSNNRIERYHSKLAPKIRSMRGVKNLEQGDQFFRERQAEANFRPARPKAELGRIDKAVLLGEGLLKSRFAARLGDR